MSRLIYADALIADLDKGLWGQEWDKALTEAIINDAPTVDAVEVVRCGECKHGEYREDFDDYLCDQLGLGAVNDANFFCSYGER